MVTFIQLERIRHHLCGLSDVVNLQQARSSGFLEATRAWLAKAEQLLCEARLPASSDLAALRSRLLVALHRRGMEARRERHRVASQALEDAQRSIQKSLETTLNRFDEAEQLALRVASVARAKGMPAAPRAVGHQAALERIRDALASDSDTAAALVHMQGLVGRFDSLVLLDRALPELH